MTEKQFDALALLLRSRARNANAARQVLLKGLSVGDVVQMLAAESGNAKALSYGSLRQTVGRFLKAHELMLDAYGRAPRVRRMK